MSENCLEIQVTEKITADDWRALTTWREHVFPPEGVGTDWIGGKMHILASSGRQAIAHIGFDIYTLIIDGKESEFIGVGAVVVIPDFQGQHLPMRMFDALREWRDEKHAGTPLALFCTKALSGYYKNHNFKACVNEVFYLQKDSYQKSKFEFMTDQSMDDKGHIYIPSNPW